MNSVTYLKFPNPFIEEIADGAFKNCTALKQISGYFTRIGEEAFKGCTSLENFNVSASTTFIGAKAFSGVPQITVKLFSEEVALKSVTEEALSAAREQTFSFTTRRAATRLFATTTSTMTTLSVSAKT